MDKVTVMYVVNGATKRDVLTGTEISIQREGASVHLVFPNGDGAYVVRWSKQAGGLVKGRSFVSYRECDVVDRSAVEEPTSTEVS